LFRHIYLFTARKKLLSKFRSREEEQFPPRKKIAPVFKGMEIVVGIFHGHSNIFLGQDNPIYRN